MSNGYLDDEEDGNRNYARSDFSDEELKRLLLATHEPEPGKTGALRDLFADNSSAPSRVAGLYGGPSPYIDGGEGPTVGGARVGGFDPGQRPSIYEPGSNEAAYGEALRKPRPEYQEPQTKWWQNLLGGVLSTFAPRVDYQTPKQRAQEDYRRQLGNYEGDIAQKRGAASLEIGERDRQQRLREQEAEQQQKGAYYQRGIKHYDYLENQPKIDKPLRDYINDQGQHVEILQRPDGSLYEQPFGKVQPKAETGDPELKDLQKQHLRQTISQERALDLTPEGLDMAARAYATTGELPAMGMGGAGGTRQKIMNRAAQLYPNLDLASAKSGYQADKGSLTALTKNLDAVVAFENTASKNLDQFLNTAKSVIDSGSPWVNQPMRAISRGVLGSGDLAAFDAARRVAVNEISKVISNPNLTGQLSDAARREVESFIPENASLKQIYSVSKILRTDMKNRHDSLDEQIKQIQGRIGGGRRSTDTSGAGGGPKIGEVNKGYRFKGGDPAQQSSWEKVQ